MKRLLLQLLPGLLFGIAAGAAFGESPLPDPAPRPDLIRFGWDSDLSGFRWIARPVVIFAENPADPRYGEQIDLLNARVRDLGERDVIVLTDTDPAADSALRRKLRPRGFMVVLIGKNGDVILRKPKPLTVRELTRSIDKMPMRQREVDERRSLRDGS